MALPDPDTLANIVKFTPLSSTGFLALLEADMNDPEKVKNGLRRNGAFSFYIPGFIRGITFDEVKKALKDAGWDSDTVEQIYGYMPTNVMVDFKNADPTTPDVMGPSTFPWVNVSIRRSKATS